MKIIIRKNIGWRLTFVGLYIMFKISENVFVTYQQTSFGNS